MVKILYVMHDTSVFSGASKALLLILRGIKGKDIEPVVALPDRKGVYNELKEMGIETIVVPIRLATYPRIRNINEFILYFLRLFFWKVCNIISVRRLTVKLKNNRPDIIHSNVSVIDVGLRTALKLNVPHIYHFREYGDKDFGFTYFPNSRIYHENVRSSGSYYIAITEDIRKHHNLQPDCGVVIYDGVFHTSVTTPSFKSGEYFLYAGRIEPAKGLLDLLHAYLSYSKSVATPLQLHVAGAMPNTRYCDSVRKFVDDNAMGNNVVFMGQCGNMNELYANARALIVPSVAEGFGFCMPEAMRQGCLVIGHDTGGTHEQFTIGLENESAEIGIRYRSEEELENALIAVHFSQPSDYDEMKARAFRTVNKMYSIESSNIKLYSFYKRIIGKS